jgi:YVTN family beta-propeller protein
VDARALKVMAEVKVGDDPRTAAFTRDGAFLLVANRGSGSVSVVDVAAARPVAEIPVGALPYGIVAGGQQAFVSLSAPGQVAVIDLAARAVARTLAVEPFPSGLALTGDETTLYVTHLYSGRVTPVDLLTFAPKQAISTGADSNLSQFIVLSPDGSRAYLPQTRSNAANLNLAYNTTVLPVVNVLDLAAAQEPSFSSQIDLAAADPLTGMNLPFAAVVGPDGGALYVANAGSDDVSVIDLAAGRVVARLSVGRHPRGIALSADGARLFVNNTLDGTLSIFDTLTRSRTHTLPLTTLPLPPALLTGKRLFNSSLPSMSQDHWVSCASCHFDGGHDARTWLGFPDGPRDTPALFGAASTLPLHWSGDLDELQDVELTIRRIQGGEGLVHSPALDSLGAPNGGRSTELDALAAYLASLQAPPSPFTFPPETLERGRRAFERWSCAACHTPPLYTDQRSHESPIGDLRLERNSHGYGLSMDTPSLLGVWATAPYFHDGSAPTLRDTLFRTGFHGMGFAMDKQEVEDLLAFLLSLPHTAGKGNGATQGK